MYILFLDLFFRSLDSTRHTDSKLLLRELFTGSVRTQYSLDGFVCLCTCSVTNIEIRNLRYYVYVPLASFLSFLGYTHRENK